MMLFQRSAMHKPLVIGAVQCAGDDPDYASCHVGIFSSSLVHLNLFLTSVADLRVIRSVPTGDLMKLTTFLKHIGNDNSGATAVEYGLIVSLIVIAMIGALNGVANTTVEMWSDVRTQSEDAMN